MSNAREMKEKFWKALESDRTVMLGIDGARESHLKPMTAQVEGHKGPIWFFTSVESELVGALSGGRRGVLTLTSKGHDLFATVHGALSVDTDPRVVDRLWNPFVASWFEHGKDDPKLRLLRFDPEQAEIWLNASSLVAGVKALFGVDPKSDYKDNVAEVKLR